MIKTNLELIRDNIAQAALNSGRNPGDISLVAVSKRFPASCITEARSAGQTIFGENYLQEAAEKKKLLGDLVKFHFIGHLQSNKAKIAAEIFDVIETVDRPKIAAALNRHLESIGRKLDILIQVNIGADPNKSGVIPEKTESLLAYVNELEHLTIRGLMTIPPISPDPESSRPYFKDLRKLGVKMQNLGLLPQDKLELSMGMSDDYQIAIEEGATLIRIGTAIFGMRTT